MHNLNNNKQMHNLNNNKQIVVNWIPGIQGAPQGSPQHRGDEVDEELDVYLGLLFKGSVGLGEEKADEVFQVGEATAEPEDDQKE